MVFGLLVLIVFLLGQMAYAGNPFDSLRNLGRSALKASTGLAGRMPGSGLARGAAGLGLSRGTSIARGVTSGIGRVGNLGRSALNASAGLAGRMPRLATGVASSVANKGISAANWVRHNPTRTIAIATTKPVGKVHQQLVPVEPTPKRRQGIGITFSTVTPTPAPKKNVIVHVEGTTTRSIVPRY
jgi:hypothetical protein